MVELRKRKEPTAAVPPPLAKRNSGSGSKIKKLADKAKSTLTGSSSSSSKPAEPSPLATPASDPPAAARTAAAGNGNNNNTAKSDASFKLSLSATIPNLSAFGASDSLTTHDGTPTSFASLLDSSAAGVVIFTYPRASTPGCTTQACLFRDSYAPIKGASFDVYGLSTDSPKSNANFVAKQHLTYPLLCDPKAGLIKAIGMWKGGSGSGVSRGVVVVDKMGKCVVWVQGGPQKTLDAVLEHIAHGGAMTEATGGSTAVAAPVPVDDPHASEEAAKLAEPKHFPGHIDGTTPGVDSEDTKMLEAPLIREATRSEEHIADVAAEVNDVAKKLDPPA